MEMSHSNQDPDGWLESNVNRLLVFERQIPHLASQAANIPLEDLSDEEIDEESEAEELLVPSTQQFEPGRAVAINTENDHLHSRHPDVADDSRAQAHLEGRQAAELGLQPGAHTSRASHERHLTAEPELSSPARTRKHYNELYDSEGLDGLVTAALRDEVNAYKTLDGGDLTELLALGYTVLAGTHPKVLQAVLSADVARRYQKDHELRTVLDATRNHQRVQDRPAVYLNQLADGRGRLPTANEMLHAIRRAESYVNNSNRQYIKDIDRMYSTSRTAIVTGDANYRKYMCHKDQHGNWVVSKTRVEKTNAFSSALKARCRIIPRERRDEPLPDWLPEFGYTHTTEKRFQNHKLHRSSNYIMNLFHAVFEYEWKQRFQLHQFVVFVCTVPIQASIAEILFTRISAGFTGDGGGFTHYPPGLSTDSADWFPTSDWESWDGWTVKMMQIQETDASEIARWKTKCEAAAVEEEARKEALATYRARRRADAERVGLDIDEFEKELRSNSDQEIEEITAQLEVELAEREAHGDPESNETIRRAVMGVEIAELALTYFRELEEIEGSEDAKDGRV